MECQKINFRNNKISFGTNKAALLNEMQSLYGERYAQSHLDLAMRKAGFIEDFFQTQKSIPALEKIGISPSSIDIQPHFFARLNKRIEEGRILSLKWVLNAFNKGRIFEEDGFKGFIIKGKNNIVMTLSESKGRPTLTSIFTQDTIDPRWHEYKAYN